MESEKGQEALRALLQGERKDLVQMDNTDDLFERAVNGPPEEFKKYFNKRCDNLKGFSAPAWPFFIEVCKLLVEACKLYWRPLRSLFRFAVYKVFKR